MAEIADPLFSRDPYLELMSLDAVLWPCTDPERMTDFFDLYGGAKQPQLQWQKQLSEWCAKHHQSYPNILTTMRQGDWLQAVQPTTELGRRIKNRPHIENDLDRFQHHMGRLKAGIKAQNSAVILRQKTMLQHIIIDTGPYAQAIGSQDHRYVFQILQLASTQLACQMQDGFACAPESGLMANACVKNSAACGLDFMTWYRQNTLPGMQSDVELMAEYLLETSQ
ncbi:hypothetical protein [Marinicella meishanensis]|uniref:hypothetical protein n=1 Tax=Marinicella meishanensis TaxID=2873263 RepID=UPI001CC0A637|nr:hypothetical protein [Marinicella sp. NBU2979]